MPETVILTPQMLTVFAILALTLYLLIFEVVRVDVASLIVMVILGVAGIVPEDHLFDGFASNAVISIIAIMIIVGGLDNTGLMTVLAGYVVKVGGSNERRVVPILAGLTSIVSGFMQNIGAAALFLPVASRVSMRTGIPLSRLLMPIGFCAIAGGTLSMIGSSPLILLNDLILNSNTVLPAGMEPMETFRLFDVTPIGLALTAASVLYFVIAGRVVTPAVRGTTPDPGATTRYFEQLYGITGELYEASITMQSPLVGMTIRDVEDEGDAPFILGIRQGDEVRIAPPRDEMIWVNMVFALMGPSEQVKAFTHKYKLARAKDTRSFISVLNPSRAGIAEILVPPGSNVIGKTRGEVRMRKRYGANVLAVHRGEETLIHGVGAIALRAGDTLIVHIRWDDLAALAKDHGDFIVITDYPKEEEARPHKVSHALFFFALAIGLVLFTDIKLSLALLVGAAGMVATGVLDIEQAYRSVSWQTVFQLASLIPLGIAMESSGAAAWLAQQILALLGDLPGWVIQTTVAVLATFFGLVMSNVGATVLLVPLAVNIALGANADPAIFALIVAIATSNAFLIPTNQVNALIMGPAGYRVADFLRAGSVMTVLYLAVMLTVLNLLY